jgi:hypothetical protein
VLDWCKGQQTPAAVKVEIEKELDEGLPGAYAVLFRRRLPLFLRMFRIVIGMVAGVFIR